MKKRKEETVIMTQKRYSFLVKYIYNNLVIQGKLPDSILRVELSEEEDLSDNEIKLKK